MLELRRRHRLIRRNEPDIFVSRRVLRFLDVDPATGKFIVNGLHQVQLPDGAGAIALGASLVVIYRDPTAPLNAIVIYDGAYTMDQSPESMSQRIQGFYQPATTTGK